jgi:hypothetical protein
MLFGAVDEDAEVFVNGKKAFTHSFATVGECKAYFDEHRAQMAARARDRGIEPGPGPRVSPCDRMEQRGLLRPAT